MPTAPDLSARTVRELYEQAASTAPSPGGGSITALTGMWGVALVLKALRLTDRRAPGTVDLAALEPQLEAVARRLEADAGADAAAYEGFIAALRLGKETPAEDARRRAALDAAAAQAAEVSLGALVHAAEGCALARSLQGRIASILVADLEAGLQLLEIVRRNAVDNAEGALAAIASDELRAGLAERLAVSRQ